MNIFNIETSAITMVMISCILVASCYSDTPAQLPMASQESTLNLGSGWTGNIVTLPTGERILLTYREHHTGHGTQISTAAVLLPPKPLEPK